MVAGRWLQAELGPDEEIRFARCFGNLQLSASNLPFALSNLQQTTLQFTS
jgi:hypothetical protein